MNLTWRFKAEITSACSFAPFHYLERIMKLMQDSKTQIMHGVAQLQTKTVNNVYL